LLVPRTSSTPVVAWSWPTWQLSWRHVLVSHVRLVGVDISFEKNFYQLPFTPPSLVASLVLQVVSEPITGLSGL
jgi:hypothetical protein